MWGRLTVLPPPPSWTRVRWLLNVNISGHGIFTFSFFNFIALYFYWRTVYADTKWYLWLWLSRDLYSCEAGHASLCVKMRQYSVCNLLFGLLVWLKDILYKGFVIFYLLYVFMTINICSIYMTINIFALLLWSLFCVNPKIVLMLHY